MNPANDYVTRILQAYLQLPDTPNRIHRLDRKLAHDLYEQKIPAETVEIAMLLATLRRKKSAGLPALHRVRSLHYFVPIIREITATPLSSKYIDYIRAIAAERLT